MKLSLLPTPHMHSNVLQVCGASALSPDGRRPLSGDRIVTLLETEEDFHVEGNSSTRSRREHDGGAAHGRTSARRHGWRARRAGVDANVACPERAWSREARAQIRIEGPLPRARSPSRPSSVV